jgi:hypothetical protein
MADDSNLGNILSEGYETNEKLGKMVDSLVEIATIANQIGNQVANHLQVAAMAAVHQAGVARMVVSDEGSFSLIPLAPDEPPPQGAIPTPTKLGTTRPLRGSGETLAWVFQGPAPYNDVEIVCSPNAESPIGFSCWATKKYPGNARDHFTVEWIKDIERSKT